MGIPPLPLLQSSVGHRPERKRLSLALARSFFHFISTSHHQLCWVYTDTNVFLLLLSSNWNITTTLKPSGHRQCFKSVCCLYRNCSLTTTTTAVCVFVYFALSCLFLKNKVSINNSFKNKTSVTNVVNHHNVGVCENKRTGLDMSLLPRGHLIGFWLAVTSSSAGLQKKRKRHLKTLV